MSLRMSLGNLMRPDYLTDYFPQYIQKHSLRRMHFQDYLVNPSFATQLLMSLVYKKFILDFLN